MNIVAATAFYTILEVLLAMHKSAHVLFRADRNPKAT